MKRIPRSIRRIIVVYLAFLVLALLWVPRTRPWTRQQSVQETGPFGLPALPPANPFSGHGLTVTTSGGGEIRYGQIGLEILVLSIIAALACYVATLLDKGCDQSIGHDNVKRTKWWHWWFEP
ncbi:hypothetical protein SMC7_01935 [Candidatus Cryosericum terrychapinii]|uniref:Uncharacterized protein n=1 Tax=Candidatus Cryosericum terrychapinii TaxID=2290919 RepID=A0A398D4V8_9BACT|nr:hypothetical protein SMC7_01935 [Candidatus Cryosericum terrychapinii]